MPGKNNEPGVLDELVFYEKGNISSYMLFQNIQIDFLNQEVLTRRVCQAGKHVL